MLVHFICRNVLSIDEYASYFDGIDPLAQYKKWNIKHAASENRTFKEMAPTICSQRVQAAFIVSDSVDWSRDIQVDLGFLANMISNCYVHSVKGLAVKLLAITGQQRCRAQCLNIHMDEQLRIKF